MIFPSPIEVQPNGCIYPKNRAGKKRGCGKVRLARPTTSYGGEIWVSARLSYHLNKEPIPRRPPNMSEGFVLHRCDDQMCINPDHLYFGNKSRNQRDIFERHPQREEIDRKMREGRQKFLADPERMAAMSAKVSAARKSAPGEAVFLQHRHRTSTLDE